MSIDEAHTKRLDEALEATSKKFLELSKERYGQVAVVCAVVHPEENDGTKGLGLVGFGNSYKLKKYIVDGLAGYAGGEPVEIVDK